MYTPATSTMRYVLPRAELRARDRRSGAYPTKARTGDRTRTGRNKLYFDDGRTVLFLTSVNVSPPTQLQVSSSYIENDLTSSFVVIGNTFDSTVDQWIPHRDQVEAPGPFNEAYLYEQNEISVVNSRFMTGAAYDVAPDRFKSNVANKTIIRMEIPLSRVSTLETVSASLHYFNSITSGFDRIASEPPAPKFAGGGSAGAWPQTFAPIPFTPYGMHHLPITDAVIDHYHALTALDAYTRSTTFDAGVDGFLYTRYNIQWLTASVVNPAHIANASQSLRLSTYFADPFLLEKAVIEMPFEAGPGWLNDCFTINGTVDGSVLDSGGPMITIALMRQNKTSVQHREIIASGTITNALDTMPAYNILSASFSSKADVIVFPRGITNHATPTVVVSGSMLSGSTNHFSGTVSVTMQPQVTSHVWRMRVSGTAGLFFGQYPFVSTTNGGRESDAYGIGFGPITRSVNKQLMSSRNVLGRHITALDSLRLRGDTNPVASIDSQYENLPSSYSLNKSKVYLDVVSKTLKSPYLLYPDDDLIICLSKHCAAAAATSAAYSAGSLMSSHDVKIPTGSIKITLYGDLIKEDREFHDTLNQRLETVELWETIGQDPVLDEFDVCYTSELSGSYSDAFNVARLAGPVASDLSSSVQLQQYYSNYAGDLLDSPMSTEFAWSRAKRVYEYRSVARNLQVKSEDELYWDCRLVNPQQALTTAPWYSDNLGLGGTFVISGENDHENRISSGPYQGLARTATDYKGTEWFMAYPFEPRFSNVAAQFDLGGSDIFLVEDESGNHTYKQFKYNQFVFELGDRPYRKLIVADFGGTWIDEKNLPNSEFIKVFYGIGDGRGPYDNNHVDGIVSGSVGNVPPLDVGPNKSFSGQAGARIRGWKYGMLNGFKTYSKQVYRRDRFGQFRDMLEQRIDTKYYDSKGVKDSPVQVKFYDSKGKPTDPLRTLSSNVSFEATSSVPYIDDTARNRGDYDLTRLNIVNTTISH